MDSADQTTTQLLAEIGRLKQQVSALAMANVHAAELMSELREARELEELLRRRNEEIERAKQVEQARNLVLETVARNEPLSMLGEALLDFAGSLLPARSLSLFVNRAEGLEHWVSANVTGGLRVWLQERKVPMDSLPGECWRRGLPMLADDMNLEPHDPLLRVNSFRQACIESGMRACASYPVLSANRAVLGVATIYRQETGCPNAEVEEMMQRLVMLAGLGLEQWSLYERLSFQAHYDALTGLPNRTLFNQNLSRTIAEARRHKRQIGVLWVDLDRFKQINDTLGHKAGDSVLKEAATRLRRCVRDEDAVARMGGDEFTVCLRNVTGSEGALQVAERLVHVLDVPFRVQDQEVVLSASIGISMYPEHGSTCEELARNADIAMYTVKHESRRGFALYSPESEERIRDRFLVETHLRRALAKGELELYYQPQVQISNPGKVIGVEALLRWDSPELGRVPPDRFIPVAESSGLIGEIGQWVIDEACRTAGSWQRAGRPIRMALNVSSEQFSKNDFVDHIREALEREALAPELLDLELTESSILKDGDQCRRNMNELREIGVRLSIDDFGTGYSSLSYLHTLPVDSVKIDRSFVRDLFEQESNLRLVEGIVSMARALKLEVVAEGVETLAQLQKLDEMGCDMAQGYYIERPLPLDRMEELLYCKLPVI